MFFPSLKLNVWTNRACFQLSIAILHVFIRHVIPKLLAFLQLKVHYFIVFFFNNFFILQVILADSPYVELLCNGHRAVRFPHLCELFLEELKVIADKNRNKMAKSNAPQSLVKTAKAKSKMSKTGALTRS
jgi:hypothetical protein